MHKNTLALIKKMNYSKLVAILLAIFSTILKIEAHSLYSEFNEKEEENYRALFENLFFVDSFSYTLFGEKPLSFEIYIRNGIQNFQSSNYSNEILNIRPYDCHAKAWLSWKKYHKINSRKFVIIDKINDNFITIILINKKALKNIFSNNKMVFARVFGENFTEENLLEKISKEESLMKALNNNEEVLGILCGFGAHNSKLFNERSDLLQSLKTCNKNLKSLNYRKSLDKKIEIYNKILSGSADIRNPPYYFQSLGFCVDKNSSETKFIQKKIEKTQNKIAQAYLDKDFYQVIMTELECTTY